MFTPKRTLLHLNDQSYIGFKGKRWAFAGQNNGAERENQGTESREKLTDDQLKTVLDVLTTAPIYVKWEKKSAISNFDDITKRLAKHEKWTPAMQKRAFKILDSTFSSASSGHYTDNSDKLENEGCQFLHIENGILKFYKSSNDLTDANEIKLTPGGISIITHTAAPATTPTIPPAAPSPTPTSAPATSVTAPSGTPAASTPPAPDTPATPENIENAKKLFEEANAKFKANTFDEDELAKFREADRLVPNPLPKYKIAVCLDKLGKTQEAIEQYQKFLDSKPNLQLGNMPQHVSDSKARIEELKKKLEEEGKEAQKTNLESIQKAFPWAKPGEITVSGTEKVTKGGTSSLYLESYQGMNEPDPNYYNSKTGQGVIVNTENRESNDIPAVFQDTLVINAPKKNGMPGRFVLVELDLGNGKKENAWVEVGKLRKKEGSVNRFKSDNEWTKPPLYLEPLVEPGTKTVTKKCTIYQGEGRDAGRMLRILNPGDKVEITIQNIRKVGSTEFVYVNVEKEGVKDAGWVQKDSIDFPAPEAEKKVPQAVPEAQKRTTTASEELIKNYYNRTTGKIDFKGDKEAEQHVTISNLFPNAKPGDKLRIKHKYEGATVEATWDPNKQYSQWVDGKMETRTGIFVDKTGQRIIILDGDTMYPMWKEDEQKAAARQPEVKQPEAPAVKGPDFAKIAEDADQKFLKNRKEMYDGFINKTKYYKDHEFKVQPSLLKVVNDEDLWKKAWNGEGGKEITGLMAIMNILKHPIFVEAGINENNAREKMLGLINKGMNLNNLIDYFEIYRGFNQLGFEHVGSSGEFISNWNKFFEDMKANEPGYKKFEEDKKKSGGILERTRIIKVAEEKIALARADGLDESQFSAKDASEYGKEHLKFLLRVLGKDQFLQYTEASNALNEVKNDPNYLAWQNYRLAARKAVSLNNVLAEGSLLLEAIGKLEVKEYKPASSLETIPPDTQKSVNAINDVFKDSNQEAWYKDHPDTRKFSWEDVVAGDKENIEGVSEFGRYFDAEAPMLRVRSKLNKFRDADGNFDGKEHMNEAETVTELNRLMKKGLTRMIAWKRNPAAVMDFLKRYTLDSKLSLPEKTGGESDEAYNLRVTPLLSKAMEQAYNELKLSDLSNLSEESYKSLPNFESSKLRIKDRKDLIKMGYYFDSRDEEKGLSEKGENVENKLSMNPYIRQIQEAAIAKGYPAENIKTIEDKFVLGVGVKVDTTQPPEKMFGAGLAGGIDLGDGWTLALAIGVDTSGPLPVSPVLGFGFHKGWKNEAGFGVGVGGGMTVGVTGPSFGVSVDGTIPLPQGVDLKIFANAGAGMLTFGAGGGIGLEQNPERMVKDLEDRISGFDQAARDRIDNEKDPEQKFLLIINNPVIGPFFRPAVENFRGKDKQQIVLDLYNTWRKSVSGEAQKELKMDICSGGGFYAGFVKVPVLNIYVPYIGPYLTFTVGKDTYVYRRQSAMSKEMEGVSEKEIQDAMLKGLQAKYAGQTLHMEPQLASAGESGDVMTDKEGNISIRKKESKIDFTQFKGQPGLDEYNKSLEEHDMRLVPDPATGLWELQVFGALGNLQILMDPGMEKCGLILKGNKVYMAPGANPKLFISREEFFTPFPKEGSPMNTIVTITNTPLRTRSKIAEETSLTGAYLYRKAKMDWEVVSAPVPEGSTAMRNTMDNAGYEANKAKLENYHEAVPGFDETKWKAYEAKINGLPFVKEGKNEPEIQDSPEAKNKTKLKNFSRQFLLRHVAEYRDLTTVQPNEPEQEVNRKRTELAALLQKEAQQAAPPAGFGIGAELTDLQMNFVMSELMDLSFTELEKASPGARRALFEHNLNWSKEAVLRPFFRNKVKDLMASGVKFNTPGTPEEIADVLVELVASRLITNVKDEDLGKKGTKLGDNWLFSSAAGAIGVGLRGVPGYITQDEYGVLGLHDEDASSPGPEGDLAKVILELESPLPPDMNDNKTVAESPLAKKLIAMPGMWFVMGNEAANQAVDGMQLALDGKPVENNAGFEKFKEILSGIRKTQLDGGKNFIYTSPDGNTFEFRLNTEIADAAHARCGNPSFGVNENIQIFLRLNPDQNFIISAGNEKVATVSPEYQTKITQFGLAGVVTIHIETPSSSETATTPTETTKPAGTVIERAGNIHQITTGGNTGGTTGTGPEL